MERTVTALPTIELDAYRKAIKASRRLGKGGTEARFQQAWEVAKRGASILKKDFGKVSGSIKESLNLENQPSGIYYLQVMSGDQIQNIKISIM